ncbi:hypothetical protein CASFOL_030646 [Castilleja foliolosa]|uniref:Uncharacterized protein n=1 Tax=Castilleja foliolosa TaxID=1961234 RepID=A0ABD3C8W4_9LAMI
MNRPQKKIGKQVLPHLEQPGYEAFSDSLQSESEEDEKEMVERDKDGPKSYGEKLKTYEKSCQCLKSARQIVREIRSVTTDVTACEQSKRNSVANADWKVS